MNKFFSKPWQDVLLIVMVVCGVYGNILGNGFVWDDDAFVVEWGEIRDLGANWSRLWAGAVPEGHEGVYRPVRSLLYGVSYSLWGLNATGYHVQGVAIQALASVLVYLIAEELTKSKVAGVAAGLWFGLQPIHVEAISFVTASFDSAGVVVMLAAVWCYLRYVRMARKGWYWASVVLAVVAYFSYELTLVLPILLAVIDWSVGRLKKKNWGEYLKVYLPYLAANLAYWVVRLHALTIPSGQARVYESMFDNLLLSAVMLVRYAFLMLVPRLGVDHLIRPGISGFYFLDFNFERRLPGISWLDLDVLVALLVVAGGVYLAFKSRKKMPLVTLGVLWFGASLVPILTAPSFGIIFAERWAYLASVGGAVVVGWGGKEVMAKWLDGHMARWLNGSMVRWVVVGAVMVGYGYLTIQRNSQWKDSITLWSGELTKRPESAIMHTNLGLAWRRAGERDKAIGLFEEAVAINPNNVVSQQALAATYETGGEFEKALPSLLYLIKLNPRNFAFYIQAADAYYQLKSYDQAERYYGLALRIEPEIPYAKKRMAELAGKL